MPKRKMKQIIDFCEKLKSREVNKMDLTNPENIMFTKKLVKDIQEIINYIKN